MPASIELAATLTEDGALADTSPRPAQTRSETRDPAEEQPAPDKPTPTERSLGRVLADRYTLVEYVGGGAHGDVWTADDRVLGERVAIKWMRQSHGASRIRREITTLRLLRIPGVVRLLDDGIEDGRPFLAMELVPGKPFPAAGAATPLPWQTVAGPTLALLSTLSHVHAAGVVHRDLKPENVLVRPDGRPVVLDFGISHLHVPGAARTTGAGQIVGTPLYIAPEQILGRAVDARTDLYAIGVMLYESLTGRFPHEAEDVQSLLRARLTKPAPPLRDLAPAVPEVVAAVVHRLLATRIEDRFESAAEVIAALRGESIAPAALPLSLLARTAGQAHSEAADLPPLDEPSLMQLFAGPDRLFHLREDAARLLWKRTEGEPARIEAELLLWTRLGFARRDGATFILDRDACRAIAAALLPGEERRLHELLSAGLFEEAARESIDLARHYAGNGDLGAATAALAEGLRAAREQGATKEESQILSTWAKVAFAEGTPRALDTVLYEFTRARRRGGELERLESLLRAAIAAPGAGGLNALERAEDVGPFSDPELERMRHRIRIVAVAGRASAALLADVLEEVDAWAGQTEEPLARLSLVEGKARLRYHEGRFAEAAALHAEAAKLDPWMSGRIAATLNSASALLEAFQHGETAERAAEAKALAASCRNPYWEGRAEWLVRSAEYRRGRTEGPDRELVDAVARIGALDLEALVCLNEAAAAMRAGSKEESASLAERAATIWRGMNRPFAAMLARALAISSGAAADAAEVEALAERAMACRGPGVGIQALGLLGRVFPGMREQWRPAVSALVREIPEASWDQRMDVLSVNEALEGAREEERHGGA